MLKIKPEMFLHYYQKTFYPKTKALRAILQNIFIIFSQGNGQDTLWIPNRCCNSYIFKLSVRLIKDCHASSNIPADS